MSQPVWQSNYVDLCGESTIRFGSACVICGARYATPVETIAHELVVSAVPGSALAQEITDLKYQRFAEFDGAFRELSITCYRCGRAACPDCWDDDNRMCAECVIARGLNRSPRVGLPGRGPLQDGRLERIAAGRHSDMGQPEWLDHLLKTEAARTGVVPPAPPPTTEDSEAAAFHSHDAPYAAASLVMPMPFSPTNPGVLAGEPTRRMPTPAPALGMSGAPAERGMTRMYLDGDEQLETNEGHATSNMVTCPRCGAANYDFVTRCTACQLQLIQICAACERLNAGHVRQCEFCGAPLERPHGWSGIQAAITQVPPEEVSQKRRAMTPMPVATPPARTAPESRPRTRTTAPRAVSTGAPALEAAAFAMPAMPALGPFETSSPIQQQAHQTWSATDRLINGIERLASFALIAVILVIIGGIVAAEVSAQADAFIVSLIHIDVRVVIANFFQQMQHLTHQDS